MSKVRFATTDLYICKLRQRNTLEEFTIVLYAKSPMDILNKYTRWFPAALFEYVDSSRVSMSNFCAVVQVAAAPYDNIKFFD